MSEFVASNGYKITNRNGDLVILDDTGENTLEEFDYLDSEDIKALREYFQAEEDKRLGRWRWPENPEYVVYPDGERWVHVVRDGNPFPISFTRALTEDLESKFRDAARAYFEAHREVKPWETPKPGEIWILTLDGKDTPALVDEVGVFSTVREELYPDTEDMKRITAGERIYPKDES